MASLTLLALSGPAAADPDGLPPSSPREIRIIPHEDGTVTVAWLAPTDSGGSPIDRYEVERRATNGWIDIGSTTALSISDNGPRAPLDDVVLAYKVTVFNEDEESAFGVSAAFLRADGMPQVGMPPPTCFVTEVYTDPPGFVFNGTCAILMITSPLPEPVRTLLQDLLLSLWAEVRDLLGQLDPPTAAVRNR